jgi:hypothetical protein
VPVSFGVRVELLCGVFQIRTAGDVVTFENGSSRSPAWRDAHECRRCRDHDFFPPLIFLSDSRRAYLEDRFQLRSTLEGGSHAAALMETSCQLRCGLPCRGASDRIAQSFFVARDNTLLGRKGFTRANANRRIRRVQSGTIYRAARVAVIGSFSNNCRGSRLGVGSSTITPTYPIIISSQVCSP